MTIKTVLKSRKIIYWLIFLFNIFFFGYQLVKVKQLDKSLDAEKSLNMKNKVEWLTFKSQIRIPEILDIKSPKNIVLRFNKNDCRECIDSIFNNTLRLARTFGKKSVHVLVSGDYNELQYLEFKRLYQYDLNVYYTPLQITLLDADMGSYYFILDQRQPKLAKNIYRIRTINDAGYTSLYYKWFKTCMEEMNK